MMDHDAGMSDMLCQCPMHGAMGTAAMVLGGLFVVAAIVALLALAVFLIRRSTPAR